MTTTEGAPLPEIMDWWITVHAGVPGVVTDRDVICVAPPFTEYVNPNVPVALASLHSRTSPSAKPPPGPDGPTYVTIEIALATPVGTKVRFGAAGSEQATAKTASAASAERFFIFVSS
jgi:hypothetical protein